MGVYGNACVGMWPGNLGYRLEERDNDARLRVHRGVMRFDILSPYPAHDQVGCKLHKEGERERRDQRERSE